MREVNRAVDTNLSCHVANKILPEEFAHDAERVIRFCRDAELIAFFNPPTSQPYTDWTRPVQALGKE
jgi:hypothetical protein